MSAQPTFAVTTGAVAELGPRPRRSYDEELALLPETYVAASRRVQKALAAQRQPLVARPAVFVGSGGAYAVAVLARDLHQSTTGRMSQALTSLELIGTPPGAGTAVVLISAGARHPDTAAAAAAALRSGAAPVLLLTERDPAELTGALADPRLSVVSLPREHAKDGFLATNSVLNLATALVRLYDSDRSLPRSLPSLSARAMRSVAVPSLQPGGRVLLLTGPGVAAAAVDLETRLSETGLAAVQLTDYRNFAHGRHYGLSKNVDETTVVALIGPSLAPLAEATLAALPSRVRVTRLETSLPGAAGALDLMCASMRLIGATASAAGLDPARPAVPEFGRRLYHLRSGRLFPPPPAEIVARKETEAGLRSASPAVRRAFSAAFSQWSEALTEARFGAIVMDYDGTVCRTEDRFSLPDRAVRGRLTGLLDSGLVLGFASGRGGSLPEDLRRWVPPAHWPAVHLALYNGARCLTLDDRALDAAAPPDDLQPAAPARRGQGRASVLPELRPVLDGLRSHPLGRFLAVTARPAQISVSAVPGSGLPQASVSELVRQVIQTTVLDDGSPCRVKNVSSGHSEDVVLAAVSKASLVRRLEHLTGRQVLAVGDQGQVGGNDFELLALRQHTLSVDRSSSDPTRCWNLSRDGRSGPALLAAYLTAVKRSRGGFRFSWEH
jgi:hypothetical protein